MSIILIIITHCECRHKKINCFLCVYVVSGTELRGLQRGNAEVMAAVKTAEI